LLNERALPLTDSLKFSKAKDHKSVQRKLAYITV